jgi:hypothetical protein
MGYVKQSNTIKTIYSDDVYKLCYAINNNKDCMVFYLSDNCLCDSCMKWYEFEDLI